MSVWSSRLRIGMIFGVMIVLALVAIVPILGEAPGAQASPVRTNQTKMRSSEEIRAEIENWEKQFEAKMKKFEEDRRALIEDLAKAPQKEGRKVFRWNWDSPANERASLWNVPSGETEDAVATGMLRICTSEAEGSEEDCVGIWQVLRNIRIQSCNRERFSHITECDEHGETLLSVMRRAQRYALGMATARSQRSRWISEMNISCDPPSSFPGSVQSWDWNHREPCERTVKLIDRLVSGRHADITRSKVIAWGGRCEDREGACDDHLACARGLARVADLNTDNAFWCVPGTPSCSNAIDPICTRGRLRDSP